MNRVRWISYLAAACLAGLALLGANPPRVRITIPAGNMKPTVNQFRSEFEKEYLAPRNPLPLFSMMYRAGIHPVDIADEARIGKTADGKARLGVFTPDGNTVTANGVEAKGVVFQVLLQGKISNVSVDCPANLTARISTKGNDNLQFGFDQPLKFHVEPAALGLPVPKDLYLVSLSLSNDALAYQFSTSPDSRGTLFEVYLDLTKLPTTGA